ncbi:helix-turn-helix transcriptional regulator [Clostridium porci]|uniref:helix-turn-helix transcriptional regulator n=1 Tax=Clostridium porci TaxID=2605778 RepID=UPI0018A6AEAE|nr:AraC family transcriptional regulator [Clostridium porci]
MITIHSIDEMLDFYISLGGVKKNALNGFHYAFPGEHSKVRFWGDLRGFSAADADFTYPRDTVVRSQFRQRYVGIGLSEQGAVETYTQKTQMIHFGEGINCFVFDSPIPFFMKISGGQRLRFQGLYFQEAFFAENNIPLYDSFWRDAKNTIHGANLHAPELVASYHRIEQCRLTGLAFDTWLKGLGMEVAGSLIDLVQQLSAQPPAYLDANEICAVESAKAILQTNLKHPPTILELCRKVGVNKNKLQKGFRLTEGKSVAEYVRTLRMERALDLLADGTLAIQEVSEAVGYQGISNFYSVFRQTFGYTPAAIQKLLEADEAHRDIGSATQTLFAGTQKDVLH